MTIWHAEIFRETFLVSWDLFAIFKTSLCLEYVFGQTFACKTNAVLHVVVFKIYFVFFQWKIHRTTVYNGHDNLW